MGASPTCPNIRLQKAQQPDAGGGRWGTEPGLWPAFPPFVQENPPAVMGLKSAKLEMFAPLSVSPERLAQLVAFLKKLGLDPTARGGPGVSAEALSPIDEALCHSSLGEPIHHVRLEFLGDAVLRLAATEFLRREHGSLPVGEQSALRSQLVSDRWLAELAAASGLSTELRLGPMAAAMLQDKQLFWPSGPNHPSQIKLSMYLLQPQTLRPPSPMMRPLVCHL